MVCMCSDTPSSCLTIASSPGVQKGHFHIAVDLIGNLMRSSTRGATPYNNVLLDIVYGIIGWVRTPARNAFHPRD